MDFHCYGEIPGSNPIRFEKCDFCIAWFYRWPFPATIFGKFFDSCPATLIAMKSDDQIACFLP